MGSVIATPTGGNVANWSRLLDLGINVVFVDREIEELPEIDVVAIGNDVSAGTATSTRGSGAVPARSACLFATAVGE